MLFLAAAFMRMVDNDESEMKSPYLTFLYQLSLQLTWVILYYFVFEMQFVLLKMNA
jgi:hypothetical protein